MTATATGGAPFVVILGGTLRANSSTERALRYCLAAVAQLLAFARAAWETA